MFAKRHGSICLEDKEKRVRSKSEYFKLDHCLYNIRPWRPLRWEDSEASTSGGTGSMSFHSEKRWELAPHVSCPWIQVRLPFFFIVISYGDSVPWGNSFTSPSSVLWCQFLDAAGSLLPAISVCLVYAMVRPRHPSPWGLVLIIRSYLEEPHFWGMARRGSVY